MLSENNIWNTPLHEVDQDSKEYKHFEELIHAFTVQVFIKRLQHLGKITPTFGSIILIAEELQSPGKAVMYAYYIHMNLPKNSTFDVEKYIELFPMGTFTEQQLNKIWDDQKVDDKSKPPCVGAHDNLIDYLCVWE